MQLKPPPGVVTLRGRQSVSYSLVVGWLLRSRVSVGRPQAKSQVAVVLWRASPPVGLQVPGAKKRGSRVSVTKRL
jgi:hypothetical protein